MSAFDRIVVESDSTKRELIALARLLDGKDLTEDEKVAVESFLVKQKVAAHRVYMTELLKCAWARFGDPAAETRAAMEAIPDPKRFQELLLRVYDYKSWQELLASPTTLGNVEGR